jgi:hypothetical protein
MEITAFHQMEYNIMVRQVALEEEQVVLTLERMVAEVRVLLDKAMQVAVSHQQPLMVGVEVVQDLLAHKELQVVAVMAALVFLLQLLALLYFVRVAVVEGVTLLAVLVDLALAVQVVLV